MKTLSPVPPKYPVPENNRRSEAVLYRGRLTVPETPCPRNESLLSVPEIVPENLTVIALVRVPEIVPENLMGFPSRGTGFKVSF